VSSKISEILLKRVISGAEKTDMSPVAMLADRELDVFQLIGRGLSTRKIAESLGLSIKTIETYRGRIKEKLLINDGVQLLRRAMQWVEEYDARDR
jgi:DNA-binding NarL/FixJ family response regulator